MKKKNILLVDDDHAIRTLVKEFLTAYGFAVEEVDSGIKCLQYLRSNKPDLLIIDLIMPDLSGIEVLAKLKEQSPALSYPVILLSADNNTQQLADDAGVKADLYLQKPFEINILLQEVKNLLN